MAGKIIVKVEFIFEEWDEGEDINFPPPDKLDELDISYPESEMILVFNKQHTATSLVEHKIIAIEASIKSGDVVSWLGVGGKWKVLNVSNDGKTVTICRLGEEKSWNDSGLGLYYPDLEDLKVINEI